MESGNELMHKYKALSQWGVHEDGSIKSPLDHLTEYIEEEVINVNQLKQEIKPVLMKLKRIWKVLNELKQYVEVNKLRDSRKTLTSLVYMVSDFEVSLATDYQELYKGLDKDLVFDTVCKGL